MLVRGQGCRVSDAAGREYLDAHAAGGSLLLGHGRREVADALADQMLVLEHFTTGGPLSTPPVIVLAEKLVRHSAGAARVSFLSSASEALDEAARLVREYHHRSGETEREWILTIRGGDYGRTLAGIAMDAMADHFGIGPLLAKIAHVAAPAEFVGGAAVDEALAELRAVVERIGAERIAALFVEPVLSRAQFAVLPEQWWRGAAEILDSNRILLVLNESATALGRTGEYFLASHFGLRPDLTIVGSALTGGYLPAAALLFSERAASRLAGADGGGSYGGHTAACAAGNAVLDTIERDNLLRHASRMGECLHNALQELTDLPIVRAVHAMGLLAGIELNGAVAATVADELRESHGILVGNTETTVSVAPPLLVDVAEIAELALALAHVLGDRKFESAGPAS